MQGATFFMGAGKKIPASRPGETIRCLTYRSVWPRSGLCATLLQCAVSRTSCWRQRRRSHAADLAGTDLKPDALKPESKPFTPCADAARGSLIGDLSGCPRRNTT
jgi:hypothetical protein